MSKIVSVTEYEHSLTLAAFCRKQSTTRLVVSVVVALLAVVAVFVVIGCEAPAPTATTSPISPPPSPLPPSVQMIEQPAPQAAAAAAAHLYTGTSYLNWDDPTVSDGWVAIFADVPLAYTFMHQWRVVDGDVIIAQGTTLNVLASHVPTDGPGTGRFNGPITWTIDLGLFTGRASLWERGCWTATSCPLTATVVLSYPTHITEKVVGECPDVCWVYIPDPGIPSIQDEDGYWLMAYITGTETISYRQYLPLARVRW